MKRAPTSIIFIMEIGRFFAAEEETQMTIEKYVWVTLGNNETDSFSRRASLSLMLKQMIS